MRKFGVAVVLLGIAPWLVRSQAEEPKLPDRVEEALWWLPEDTQTFIVARGPFDKERFLDQREFLSYLMVVPEDDDGQSIALAVTCGRHFRSPKGLGQWLYEGAAIVIYKKLLGSDWEDLKKTMTEGAAFQRSDVKVEKIRGHEVIVEREERWETVWTTYLCRPAPNISISATNRSYLETILDRMEHKAKTRALPSDLPEWKLLEVTKPIWGIRHYDQKDLAGDPSSPYSRMGDDQGIGLVFETDPEKSRVVTIKYLSGNKDIAKHLRGNGDSPDEELTLVIQAAGPGVAEISMTIEGPAGERDSNVEFLLFLDSLLGYGANL